MAVHLVAVKVSVVSVTVGIVHSQRLLLDVRQHSGLVRHDGRLVQRGLAVHEHHVTVDEMAVDLVAWLVEQQPRLGHALLQRQLGQRDELAVGLFYKVGACRGVRKGGEERGECERWVQ